MPATRAGWLGTMVLVCSMGGQAGAAPVPSKGRDVDEVRQQFNRAYRAGDANAIANLLTDDVEWLPPGEAPLSGKDAVRRRYASQFAAKRSTFTLSAGESLVSGDLAVLQGTYQRADVGGDGGPGAAFTGNYLMVLRRQAGAWKIARDIWNGDVSAEPRLAVDAQVALNEFQALVEQRLTSASRMVGVLAVTSEAKSGNWDALKPLLAVLSKSGFAADAIWYAQANGSYSTVELGPTGLSLADRPYFPDLLAGRDVIGALVISRSTGKRSLVVASPVRSNERVIGAVGVSLSVEELSAELDKQMGLPTGMAFYALDAKGQTALHRDPARLLEYPSDLGDPSLRAAVTQMLTQQKGLVNYRFQGVRKSVLFQHSGVLSWVFALGFNQPGAAGSE